MIKLTGRTLDGTIMILMTLSCSLGMYAGIKIMDNAISWPSLVESQVFLSHSSALAGCVEENKFHKTQSSSNDAWTRCVTTAQKVSAETREILTKEPVKMFQEPQK